MLYTLEWILEKYAQCNQDYFSGQLPPLSPANVHITKNKNPWGRGGCEKFRKNPLTGEYQAIGVYLELSNYYDVSEKEKLEVLVHEMCHIYEYFCEPKYYIYCRVHRRWTQEHPKHGHGKVFYEQAERLKPYGFNVTRFVDSETSRNADVSDEIINKKKNTIEKGFHFFNMELKVPGVGRKGLPYSNGYCIPASTILDKYRQWIQDNAAKFIQVQEYISNDPNMLKIPTIKKIGIYYLTNSPNILKDNNITYNDVITLVSDGEFVGEKVDAIVNINDMAEFEDNIKEQLLNKAMKIKLPTDSWGCLESDTPKKFKITLPNGKILEVAIHRWIKPVCLTSKGVLNLRCEDFWRKAYEYQNDKSPYTLADLKEYFNFVFDSLDFSSVTPKPTEVQQTSAPEPEPVSNEPHRIPQFRFNFNKKDGTSDVFELTNVTKEELEQQLRQRFPKWSDEVIQRVMTTPKYFPMGENIMKNTKTKLTEADIKKMVKEAIKEIQKQKKKDKYPSMPDIISGHVDFN